MIKYITKKLFQDDFEKASISEIIEYCSDKLELCIDIETTSKKIKHTTKYEGGLDPYLSEIIMFQIGDHLHQFILDVRDFNLQELKPLIDFLDKNEHCLFIIHNAKFECKFLKKHWNVNLIKIWDTMLAERILYNGLGYSNSLKSLIERYFNIKGTETELFDDTEDELSDEDYDEISSFLNIDNVKEKKIDKSIRSEFVHWGMEKPFTEAQINYGADDIIFPFQIKKLQEKGRTLHDGFEYKPLRNILFQSSLTRILANMELRGVKVNVLGWIELYENNKKIQIERRNKLNNWILKYYKEYCRYDMFNPDGVCVLDWDSPKEIVKFTKRLGICPKGFSKQTKRIEYTVGAKEVYLLLSNKNKENFILGEEVDILDKNDFDNFWLSFLFYKKALQLVNSFGIDWIKENVHPITKRVHTNFLQLMNTGRMSSINPNCQNLPNSKSYRSLFITDLDKDVYACDFSTQEFRVFAHISNNESLIDFFNKDGSDIHSEVATKMFRVIENNPSLVITKKDKDKRSKAKSTGFKIIFGGQGSTLAKDFGVSNEEGNLFYDAFLDGFPGMRDFFEKTKKEAVKKGYFTIDIWGGSLYFYPHFNKIQELQKKAMSYFPEKYKNLSKEERKIVKDKIYADNPEVKKIWKEWGALKSELERKALNYSIQGSSSIMSKICMYIMEKDNFDLDEGLLLFVHDEGILEYKKNNNKEEFIKDCFSKSGNYVTPSVPISGDLAIGSYWIH